MNIPFTLPNEVLDKPFLSAKQPPGSRTLKGHRVVGGMRASLYNAMPEAGVDALVAFMADFAKQQRLNAMATFKIKTLNSIAVAGLDRLPRVATWWRPSSGAPDAILLRSFKMHDMELPDSAARGGACRRGHEQHSCGEAQQTSACPCSTRRARTPTPSRSSCIGGPADGRAQLPQAARLRADAEGLRRRARQGRRGGQEELRRLRAAEAHALGVVGLGAIGVEVANAALRLGMNVLGYDPAITVQHAWAVVVGRAEGRQPRRPVRARRRRFPCTCPSNKDGQARQRGAPRRDAPAAA